MSMYDELNCSLMVKQERYDELLHKETILDAIIRLHGKTTGYSFHDVVGYLIKTEVMPDE